MKIYKVVIILKRIWNPIDCQGHRVKFLGEGIRHALRCPCFIKSLLKYQLRWRGDNNKILAWLYL
jgi:hypothetical protein